DAYAIQRVMRKIFSADGIPTLDGSDEFFGGGRQVRDHHLPPSPVLPYRAGEDHGAVMHLAVAHMLGSTELGEELALAPVKEERFANSPGTQGVVQPRAQRKCGLSHAAKPAPEGLFKSRL